MTLLNVTLAYSPEPGVADEIPVRLEDGATLRDALQAGGWLQRHPEVDSSQLRVGVWGSLRSLEAKLREGDRVEIYRPLQVDPMQARRLRQQKQLRDRQDAGADPKRRSRALRG